MSKNIKKNDPCLCGSGRKFKRCCQVKEPSQKPLKPALNIPKRSRILSSAFGYFDTEDKLTYESNRVVDLIDEGLLDEAEACAHKLLLDFPYVHDGFERLATVYEKRCDLSSAIEMYQRALDFTLNNENYDEEMRDYYRRKIAELKRELEE